jgi:hypothetical protein
MEALADDDTLMETIVSKKLRRNISFVELLQNLNDGCIISECSITYEKKVSTTNGAIKDTCPANRVAIDIQILKDKANPSAQYQVFD